MFSTAPKIRSIASVLPEHYADQETLIRAFRELWSNSYFNVERLENLHRAVTVKGRHLALPVGDYATLTSFSARNDAWIRCALDLGERAARQALDKAGLTAADVDHIYFVTVTGLATPSIDARLMNRMGFRPFVKRTPIAGLGCVAGASGIARAADVLRAFDGQVALLLSVELCSLTLQREDLSIANIVASGLFGDGAAAVVLTGGVHTSTNKALPYRTPAVVTSRSVFYPDTERVMGWDIVDTGFKVVLSAKIPELVQANLGKDVDAFLADCGLTRADIRHWIAHTGGPKVLEAIETALSLPGGALKRSWDSLADVGNLSSASVLFVLQQTLEANEAAPGDYGMLLAMGPGFSSELVLLRW